MNEFVYVPCVPFDQRLQ